MRPSRRAVSRALHSPGPRQGDVSAPDQEGTLPWGLKSHTFQPDELQRRLISGLQEGRRSNQPCPRRGLQSPRSSWEVWGSAFPWTFPLGLDSGEH